MNDFFNSFVELANQALADQGYNFDISSPLGISMLVVALLICIMGVVALVFSIALGISYMKYNRRQNSAGLTGEETARKILDDNGLEKIKVKTVGSLIFGNSYSHYFKKVRLRRLTKNKTSISALAMGAQKSALAVLDKEGDPDMKRRVRLVPLITFGPFMFIPLLVIGAVVDYLAFNGKGSVFIVAAVISVIFYLLSFILSISTLKTEKKAQNRAYDLLRQSGMATEEELGLLKKLFRLYNIQYVIDTIISALELLYRILQIFAAVQSNNSAATNNN